MRSAEEWLRGLNRTVGGFIFPPDVNDIRAIQADALEAAAQAILDDPDAPGGSWIPEHRECATVVRALKPEGT